MIPIYCDANPEQVDAHSLPPGEGFAQTIGAMVDLQCMKGYKGRDSDMLTVECVELTQESGEWHTDNECQCTLNVSLHIFTSVAYEARALPGEGKGGNPPETEKNVVEKWCYFRRLYF